MVGSACPYNNPDVFLSPHVSEACGECYIDCFLATFAAAIHVSRRTGAGNGAFHLHMHIARCVNQKGLLMAYTWTFTASLSLPQPYSSSFLSRLVVTETSSSLASRLS